MSYEMMVGLQIKNDAEYTRYREAMGPILKMYGGGFRYDFKISETLRNEESRPINRVFAIYFENKEKMNEFFNNPDYVKAKKTYFNTSVEATTILSEYHR
ncbi:DUF1330 domain-containing protein [Halobacteriovorax sp.]|uniref:DUF1330 domain-containing protein n=1 Tax=Halobacteriovorax sp. TaxID=2020862 RepID=UPI0035655EC9